MDVAAPARRDRYVDLLRAVSIGAVVLGHWTVGSVVPADGGVEFVNLLDIAPRTHPLTWLFQVMPVFFLVGGYANAASLASPRRGTIPGWIRRRALRLLRPATIVIGVVLVVRLLAPALDAVDLAHNATWAAVTPLWFLVVYLGVLLVSPWAVAAHQRWGWGVVLVLVAGVALGDILRLTTGSTAPASANYALAWLAIHQVGIIWRDGGLPTTRRGAVALLAGGLATALLLVGPGPYGAAMVGAATPPDLSNTAPPTLALLALAAAQTGAVLLLRPLGTAWVARPRVWALVARVNLVILTVFLWHMAVLVIVGFALVGTGLLPVPDVGSAAWWAWRIPWIVALSLVLALLVALLGPVEAAAPPPATERPSAVAVGAGLVTVLIGLGVLGVTDTVGAGPQLAGIPVAEVALVLRGLVTLERA